ncbi:MAG: hypothetical protein ABW252_15910 [Polyangiales bacterium]
MDVRLFLRLAVCSTLVLGAAACSTDAQPQRPTRGDDDDSNEESSSDDDDDESDDDDNRSTRRDAGRDAGKDAGGTRTDAGRDGGTGTTRADAAVDAGRDASGPAVGPVVGDAGGDAPAAPDQPGPTTTEPGSNPPPTVQEPADPCASLTFTSSGASGVVEQYCVSCHNPNGVYKAVLLDSETAVKRLAMRVAARVGAGTMPPASADARPSANEAEQLLQWIRCGAN